MLLLSICILMKADGNSLRRLAAMVNPLADELIVVCDDPVPSAFQTVAQQCEARVIPHIWNNDFSAARNAGLEAAKGEWVFWIDSDETLLTLDPTTVRNFLNATDALAYYVTIEDSKSDATMSPRKHLSIYRRRKEIRYVGRIHEHFEPPLDVLAREWGMKVLSLPICLRHTGYQERLRAEKLRRNIALLELELADRPGQIYYLIELGRSLLVAGQPRGHTALAEAAQSLHPFLKGSRPPNLLVAALLEYALGHTPANFPISRAAAAAAAGKWFPHSPPLVWRAARWHYEEGRFDECAELLERLLKMEESKNYDETISFNQRIFGDETYLNLGVCYARLGERNKALESLKHIRPDSSFFEMAQTNINHLKKQA